MSIRLFHYIIIFTMLKYAIARLQNFEPDFLVNIDFTF